jgi:hypothetical protein
MKLAHQQREDTMPDINGSAPLTMHNFVLTMVAILEEVFACLEPSLAPDKLMDLASHLQKLGPRIEDPVRRQIITALAIALISKEINR